MAKLDSLHHDLDAVLTNLMIFALAMATGLFISFIGAQARAWAPLDVTWTQKLHEEFQVIGERFTGQHGDHPDWIAGHCGRSHDVAAASNCPKR